MDEFTKQKGRGRHSGRGRKDGGGLLRHRCLRHGIVDGNKRNGRGHCSWRCSLRSKHRHVRLILVLVVVLGEPGGLGDSDGGDFFFFVMVRGRVRGCVEELCWLFFVPYEQSAPMSVMLRIPEQ
jgi:hypothetical protein